MKLFEDKTTIYGYIAATAAFVAFAPELFPQDQLWGIWVQKLAAFISMGGIIGLGHSAKNVDKGSDRPQEIVDEKLDSVKPFDAGVSE